MKKFPLKTGSATSPPPPPPPKKTKKKLFHHTPDTKTFTSVTSPIPSPSNASNNTSPLLIGGGPPPVGNEVAGGGVESQVLDDALQGVARAAAGFARRDRGPGQQNILFIIIKNILFISVTNGKLDDDGEWRQGHP